MTGNWRGRLRSLLFASIAAMASGAAASATPASALLLFLWRSVGFLDGRLLARRWGFGSNRLILAPLLGLGFGLRFLNRPRPRFLHGCLLQRRGRGGNLL